MPSDRHLAEPPKSNFEESIPRGMREMQRAIKRMQQQEEGVYKPRPLYREDMPRSEGSKLKDPKGRAPDRSRESAVGSDAAASGRSKKEQRSFAHPDESAKVSHSGTEAIGKGSVDGQRSSAADVRSGGFSEGVVALLHGGAGKKRGREHDMQSKAPRAPRFGETNDAPPALVIGGQLSRLVAAARTKANNKADEIARQRQHAIDSYRAAKAARRDGRS